MNQSNNGIPSVYALLLVDVAAQWHVTSEQLLAKHGLTYQMLLDPQKRLSLETMNGIVVDAIELTQQLGLAFFFAQKMQVSTLGFLGFAAMAAHNVREALLIGERFAGMISDALTVTILPDDGSGESCIEIGINTQIQPLRDLMVLAVSLGLLYMGQTVTGQTLSGRLEVDFEKNDIMTVITAILPGQFHFGQSYNRMYFPSNYMEMPLVMANPIASQLAIEQCEETLARFGLSNPFVAQIKALMQHEQMGYLSLTAVAERLHMSERTLKRQLAKHGLSYGQLLEESRQQRAKQLLQTHIPIAEIAELLGYSDNANFIRAFKRWTEQTPAQYRKSLLA